MSTPNTKVGEDSFHRASDVNADPPGSRQGPAGSGDRDEVAIRISREKLERFAYWDD